MGDVRTRRSRADGQRGGRRAPPPRRRGYRWQQARPDPGQCARARARILYRAESCGVMTALNDLTITAALSGLDKGDFSAPELTEVHLSAMALQRGLNAFLTETPDNARTMPAA